MNFFDWTMIDHVANVGTFIIALLTYFKGKKIKPSPRLKNRLI